MTAALMATVLVMGCSPTLPPEADPSSHQAASLMTPAQIDGSAFPPRLIALTWDDGPDARTLELAQYLRDQNVSATFFVVGEWPSEHPFYHSGYEHRAILPDLVAYGHRIANHTYHHASVPPPPEAFRYDDYVRLQIRANQLKLDPHITNELYLFRPPGGYWPPEVVPAVRRDPYLDKLTGPIGWDFDSFDYDCSNPEARCSHLGTAVCGASDCVCPPPSCDCTDPACDCTRCVCTASGCGTQFLTQFVSKDHGIVLNHDRLEAALGSPYSLDVAKAFIPELKARGFIFVAPVLTFSAPSGRSFVPATTGDPNFSDLSGWDWGIDYYGTFRMADVNGDGQADVCARGISGTHCALAQRVPSSGPGSSPRTQLAEQALWSTEMSDANQWNAAWYSTTAMLGDVNGDGRADLCARGANGIMCGLANAAGTGFALMTGWSAAGADGIRDFSNADGPWASDIGYYGTLRLGDLNGDGKADICGRGPEGLVCGLSSGASFSKYTGWLTTDMKDGGPRDWKPARYSTTLQLGDVNGDGRADVCGRGPEGLVCALANASATGFGALQLWSATRSGVADFSDADPLGWASDVGYHGTLRLADINGDKRADVCGRGPQGIVCGLSGGASFTPYTLWMPFLSDPEWKPARYSTTLMLADFNGDGRADVCVRGVQGILCGLAP
jgi:peptidoglycan/xylan/chitin deacetylase (PgdA/CDA1 family)